MADKTWLKQPTKSALLSVLKRGAELDVKTLSKVFDGVLFKSEFNHAAAGGTVDHTELSSIGTNSHTVIDAHIANALIHFTKASIDHTGILNIGTNSHAAIDLHIGDGTIHFTEGSIDHTAILNIGTNTHAQIDTFIWTTVPATYLPLTAGSGKALTGGLYLQYSNPEIVLENSSGAFTNYVFIQATSTRAYFNLFTNSNNATIDIQSRPDDGTSAALVQINRTTETTGDQGLVVYEGLANPNSVQHKFSGLGNVDLCQQAGELTVGDATNKILIDPVNGIYLYGSATAWDDLRFPATRLRINPATTKPDFDYTNVGLLFDASSTETVYCIAQMPHTWEEGSDISPHIHWLPTNTNTGNVYWRMEYKWTNIGDTTAAGFTTLNVLDAGDGTAGKHQIAEFADISGAGKTISSILSIKLSRIGGDGTDTYNADALMKEFDIHYQIDSLGSDDEYTKGP